MVQEEGNKNEIWGRCMQSQATGVGHQKAPVGAETSPPEAPVLIKGLRCSVDQTEHWQRAEEKAHVVTSAWAFSFSLINRNIWPLKKITGPDVWNLCWISQMLNSSFTVLLCTIITSPALPFILSTISAQNTISVNICTKHNLHKQAVTQRLWS